MAIRPSIIEPTFDSFFDPAQPGRPALLRIRLKVTLVPLDPSTAWARASHGAQAPGAAPGALPPSHLAPNAAAIKRGNVADLSGRQVPCRSWLANEWTEFTRRLKHTVENAWNNQMVFLPVESGDHRDTLSDPDFRKMIGNPKMPAHVQGALEIDLQPPGSATHAVIEVVHLANPGDNFRDRMTRITDESVLFTESRFAARGIVGKTGQIVAAHEIGHWLRNPGEKVFDHIDRAYALTLPRAQRDDAQYGRTLSRYQSLMGGGSVVGDHEAAPWINRLRRHTSMKLGWVWVHKLRFHWSPDDLSARQRRLISNDTA